MTNQESSAGSARPGIPKALWLAMGLLLFSAVKLLWYVRSRAVNVLYWDQWECYEGLFRGVGWGRLFSWQYGPHRMGLGLWLTRLAFELSHWDERADSYLIVLLLLLGTVLALRIKRRAVGGWQISDLLLIAQFTSLAAWETLVGTAVPSIGAVPFLLVLVGGWVLLQKNRWVRAVGLCALQPLLVFTGYGVVGGGLSPYFLANESWAARHESTRVKSGLIALWFLSLLPPLWFLATRVPAVGERTDFFHTHASLSALFQFFGASTAYLFGLLMYVPGLPAIGILAFCSLLILVGRWHLELWRRPDNVTNRALCYLLTFTLTFFLLSGLGRVGLGVRAAYTSRYYVLMLPAILALHLWICGQPRIRFRQLGLSGIALGYLILEVFLGVHQLPKVDRELTARRGWAACYLEAKSAEYCDSTTDYRVNPYPQAAHLDDKMRFLEARGLGLFASPRAIH